MKQNLISFATLLLLLSTLDLSSEICQSTVIRTFDPTTRARMGRAFSALPPRSLCHYRGAQKVKPGEFYRLPETVTPSRYRLRLRLDTNRQKLYGHSMISIVIHNRTNVIELNSLKLTINGASFRTKNVKVDAGMVYYCPEKETIVLYFPKQLHKGRANLTINFSGNLTEMTQAGFFKSHSTNSLNSTVITTTDFGPTDARRHFPCFDQAHFRAVFDLYLIVPRGYQALFNVPSNRRRPYSADSEEIRFESTPPLAPFQLATVVAGPKFQVAKLNDTVTTSNVSISVYHSQTDESDEEAWHYALDTAEELLTYYRYYFDQAFPLKKLDLVALPSGELQASSIEKLGLMIFSEQQLLIANQSTASEEELQGVAGVVSHALAHQWLGSGLVAFKQWSDFWLFEALASFMERESLQSLFPHWRVWERFSGHELRKGLVADASRFAVPLSRLIGHPNDILSAVAYSKENAYFKAVSLLRMLRSAIGEETFQKGIRLFVASHANQSATADDLWSAFQRAIGKDAADKVDELAQFHLEVVSSIANWTRLAGYPVIHVTERQDGETRVLQLRQQRFLESSNQHNQSNLDDQIWPIPVSVINSFNPFSPTHQALVTNRQVELRITGEIWEGEWVKLNPEFGNFYRVHYSEEMLARFAVSVEEKLLSPMDRLNLVDDLFAFIRSGHVSTDVGLRFLWSYETEDNPNVWAVIVAAMNQLDTLISGVEQGLAPSNKSNSNNSSLQVKYRQYGQQLLTKQYERLGWYPPESSLPSVGQKMRVDEMAQSKLRENILCLMSRLKGENFTAVASGKFQDYILGQSDLSLGLLECVFRSFSSFPASANQTTFAKLFQYYREYDLPEARHLFSIALGSTEKPTEIKRVIDFALESIVRPEDTHTMLKELCARSAEGRKLVISRIASKFFNFVHKLASFNAVYHLLKDVLETFSSTSEVSGLEKLFARHSQLKLLHTSLQYSLEQVATFEQWIRRDQTAIELFFEKATAVLNSESLNHNDDLGNADDNSNAIEDNFFDFEEFDRRKKKK